MPKLLPREVDQLKLEERIKEFPWYVVKFIDHKEIKLSPSSLLGYLSDYEIYFNWLLSEQLTEAKLIKDIPLSTLEDLSIDEANNFRKFLMRTTKSHRANSATTVNRKLSALRSLFNYLQNKAEDDNKQPLLKQNVMAKVELVAIVQDVETKAALIEHKILNTDKQIEEFRDFIASGFAKLPKISKKQLSWYHDNRERDLAIVSLILSSGLRVSEIASLTQDSIDWDNKRVLVRRKGNKEQSIPFSGKAKADLKEYELVRDSRFKPADKESIFFLTKGGPMTKNTIQKMIMRYAAAYGKPLTVHKLRHTFATRFYREEKDHLKLQALLGHSDPKTTVIYTHIGKDELNKAVDRVDK